MRASIATSRLTSSRRCSHIATVAQSQSGSSVVTRMLGGGKSAPSSEPRRSAMADGDSPERSAMSARLTRVSGSKRVTVAPALVTSR